MSSPPTTQESRTATPTESASEGGNRLLEQLVPTLAGPIRQAGFWTAIVLPFLYVPLLVTGLSTAAETGLFLGFLAVNLLALYVGHAYRR
jgi:hypothetical protein